MTGEPRRDDDDATPPGGLRRPRLRAPRRTEVLVAALLAVLGFGLVVQARQGQDDLSTLRQADLVRLLDELGTRQARLEEEAAELRRAREELRTGTDRAAAAEAAARRRLDVRGILARTVPPTGPGVELAATAFVDAGDGVAVDEEPLTPPYTLVAIGDGPTLASALDIPGGVLDTLRQAGAEGRVQVRDALTVAALRPVRAPQYSQPAPARTG